MPLLIASFFLIYLFLANTNAVEENTSSPRFAVLCYTAVVWSVLLYVMTELLSLAHALTERAVTVGWAVVCIAFGAALLVILKKKRRRIRPGVDPVFVSAGGKAVFFLPMIPVAALAAYVFVLALGTVPYNWDCLAYHLPRICFWAQNRSVAHYATNDVRQLSSPVFAEFVNLHVYLLCGKSDTLFNVLQCLSYLFGGILVYHIAAALGCRRNWSYTSVILYLAVPILFAEALTPQVELVAMVWLLILVYLWIDVAKGKASLLSVSAGNREPACIRFLAMGACIGLGYETKPSVCIGQALFTLILFMECLRRREKASAILFSVLAAFLPAILIPAPEIARNLITFGTISNEQVGARQLIGRRNPRYVLTNFVKNFCYNLPNDLMHGSSDFVTKFVYWFAGIMHVDLNDPSIAESGMEYAEASAEELGNDRAVNPLIVWSMMAATVSAFVYGLVQKVRGRRFRFCRGIRQYYVWGSVLSFLLMMALIRWEPYEVRYETAYFALLCPVIACVGDSVTGQHPSLSGAWIGIEICLSVLTLQNLLTYHTDIMLNRAGSRPDGYFVYLGGMESQLKWMTEEVRDRGWKTIGLYPMNSYPEYPILAMMQPYADTFGYVIYEPDHYANVSMYEYDDPDFHPDCIIWLRDLPEEEYMFHGVVYDGILGEDGYYILYSSGTEAES